MPNERDTNKRQDAQVSSHRRRFLTVAGSASIAALAGCTGDGGDGGSNGGGSSDSIKIGLVMPTQIPIGIGSERSAQIAVDEINEDGGILGRDVELVVEDSELQPSVVQQRANGMMGEIDYFVGPYTSEATIAVTDPLAREGIPHWAATTGSPDYAKRIEEDYELRKTSFRGGTGNMVDQSEAHVDHTAQLAEEFGWENVAVVVEDALWNDPMSNFGVDRLENEHGLNVVYNESVAPDTEDFTPILDNIESAGTDVAIHLFAIISGTGFLSAWGENEYPFALSGGNTNSTDLAYWDNTNGAVEYELSRNPGCLGGAAILNDKTQNLLDKYQDRYDSAPGLPTHPGASCYDGIHVYKSVIEEVGSADYDSNRDEIVATFENNTYVGAQGTYEWRGPDDEKPPQRYTHDNIMGPDRTPMVGGQWIDGDLKIVYPDKYAQDDYVLPSWLQ